MRHVRVQPRNENMKWLLRPTRVFFFPPFSFQTSLKASSTRTENPNSEPLKMLSDCVIREEDVDVKPSGRKALANAKMQITYRLWLAQKQRRVEVEIWSAAWERAERLQLPASGQRKAQWDSSHRPWRPNERLTETCRAASCATGGALPAELMAPVSLIHQLITSGHRVLMKESPH